MKKLFLTLLLVAASVSAFAASDFTIDAPAVVEAGEQFRLNFTASGDSKIEDFQWEGSTDFQVVWGPSTSSSSSIQIINGKTTKSKSISYSYVLIAPSKAGSYKIASASVKINGSRVYSGEKTIEVAGGAPKQQTSTGAAVSGQTQQQASQGSSPQQSGQKIFLRFTTSKRSAVLGEPLTAELKLYSRVNIAGFEGVQFPSFEGFWNKETYTPEQIEFNREQYNGEVYEVATLRRYALIPQKVGDLTIEPAEIVTLVNVRRQSASQSIFDDFFDSGYSTQRYRLTTEPVTIKVKSLPAGAPASFCGGVGEFEVSALLGKDSLSVHEATTLTIVVKGTGNISLVKEPQVVYPLDVENYEAKTSQNIAKSGITGMKTYEIPIIPRSAGTFTFDPIPFTYFDTKSQTYKTIYTKPLTLKVVRGSSDVASGAVDGLVSSYNQSTAVKTLSKDIRYISTNPGRLTEKGSFIFGSKAFWAIVAFILIAATAVFVGLRKAFAARQDVVGRRVKKASKAATARLKAAKSYMDQGISGAFYEELHRALVGYVSDKLNLAGSEVSKDVIREKLTSRGIAADVIDDLIALLEDCEMARYAPSAVGGDPASHFAKAGEVISTIDRDMKPLSNKSTLKSLVIIALLLPGFSALAAPAQADSLFMAGVAAYAEGNYFQAAEDFKAVSDLGLESSELYTNLADSYFKCGELGQAVLYYNKALKLNPDNKDAQFNLDIVKGQLRDKIETVPEFILTTWSNRLCYSLSGNAWCVIFLVFLALLAASVVVFFLAGQSLWKKISFSSAIVSLVVALVSCIYAAKITREYNAENQAVIMESVVAVKNAPAATGTADLFILHEGATVKILDTIGSYVNIEIADGRSGWIKSSSIEIF